MKCWNCGRSNTWTHKDHTHTQPRLNREENHDWQQPILLMCIIENSISTTTNVVCARTSSFHHSMLNIMFIPFLCLYIVDCYRLIISTLVWKLDHSARFPFTLTNIQANLLCVWFFDNIRHLFYKYTLKHGVKYSS